MPLAILLILSTVAFGQTQLTIYNQNFATVKERRTLDLKKGDNEIRVTDITAHLEPESVVLRHLRAPGSLQILEQNYESDPLSEGLLLRKSEGKVLDFEIIQPGGEKRIVKGRILRSGYVPHTSAYQRYGQQYAMSQQAYSSPQGGGQPIVEVEGKIQFGLPGKAIFDALDPKAFLKPTLLWRLLSAAAGQQEIELSYLTGGMRWEANYNAVAPEKGDTFDITGWVTLENMSGKDFEDARVKLMAGDVARAAPDRQDEGLAQPKSQCPLKGQSLRRPSRSTISTRSSAPPPSLIAKSSRWSSCAPQTSPPSGCTSTTASRSTTNFAAGTPTASASGRNTAICRTRKYGRCSNSRTLRNPISACRCRAAK